MAYSIGVSVYCDLVMSFDCIKAAYEKYPFALAWKQCLRKEEFGRGGVESHFSSIYYEWLRCRAGPALPRPYHGPALLPF